MSLRKFNPSNQELSELAATILAAELGVPSTMVVSFDGITATITPKHSNSAAPRPVAVEAGPEPEAGLVFVRSLWRIVMLLDPTSATTIPTTTGAAPRQSLPRLRPSTTTTITSITAQTVARSRRNAAARATLAVQWMNGRLDIVRRTGAMAATIFRVHQTTVGRALAWSTDAPATLAELLTYHWERASEADRDRFVRRHLVICEKGSSAATEASTDKSAEREHREARHA